MDPMMASSRMMVMSGESHTPTDSFSLSRRLVNRMSGCERIAIPRPIRKGMV